MLRVRYHLTSIGVLGHIFREVVSKQSTRSSTRPSRSLCELLGDFKMSGDPPLASQVAPERSSPPHKRRLRTALGAPRGKLSNSSSLFWVPSQNWPPNISGAQGGTIILTPLTHNRTGICTVLKTRTVFRISDVVFYSEAQFKVRHGYRPSALWRSTGNYRGICKVEARKLVNKVFGKLFGQDMRGFSVPKP